MWGVLAAAALADERDRVTVAVRFRAAEASVELGDDDGRDLGWLSRGVDVSFVWLTGTRAESRVAPDSCRRRATAGRTDRCPLGGRFGGLGVLGGLGVRGVLCVGRRSACPAPGEGSPVFVALIRVGAEATTRAGAVVTTLPMTRGSADHEADLRSLMAGRPAAWRPIDARDPGTGW